ncbi:MAG: hypothetical protein J6M59_08725 [Bacteroidaceae bacterium]|nr:hypothetical protein [Bacteroidaceae bacterium]MBP3245170.1 hypothetical protein [Bacteroidaceae bacterium]
MRRLNLLLLMLMFFGYVHADDILPKNDSTMKEAGGGVDPTSENVKKLHLYSKDSNNVITFSESTKNCVLYVYNESGAVVYATVIPDGSTSFLLPSYLPENYYVVVTDGNYSSDQNYVW